MDIIRNSTSLFIPALLIRDSLDNKKVKQLEPKLEQCVSDLKDNGACVAPFTLSAEFIKKARDYIDSNIEIADQDPYGADKRIYEADKKSNDINSEFSNLDSIKYIGERYLSSDILLQTTLAAKLDYAPNNLGSGQGWHRDSYSRQFKAIAYLTDVDEDSGPFEFLIGSHKISGIVKELIATRNLKKPADSRFSEDMIEMLKDKLKLQSTKVCAPAGSILLADVRNIHRGHPINPGNSRYALTNYFIKRSHLKKGLTLENPYYQRSSKT